MRSIEDILDYTKRYQIEGRLISIDFKKAFDSVSRDFLFRALFAFHFGPSFIQWISTFYNNISSCVLNNGFSTAPFEVQRGVRQGDPLSSYLFIIFSEMLTVSIRSNKNIQGIMVDGEEIKLELFADDLTAFLLNDNSLLEFLELLKRFGECSGLKINYVKSEMMLLGDCAYSLLNHSLFKSVKMKAYVKILGIHFTYNYRIKHKMNFDELITSIKAKLRIWRWRDLTIIGRIQIVKTFIIPIFLYRASVICLDKEFVNEANRIIFNFIWKGKDKIKRLALISDIEDGGLKAPHLESIIKTQRILCCKRLASEQPSSWKTILLHYLKPVGGKFILCCDFDVKTLPIKLPTFYEECLKSFAECSVANQGSVQNPTNEDLSKIILWNNKAICVDGKSVYNNRLEKKGVLRIGDLISKDNTLIINHLRELNISPLDAFLLLNGQNVLLSKVVSKIIYKEIRNRNITPPTAQLKYNAQFVSDELDWKRIYSLPHRVALDTKSREFQYKLLNRSLATNVLLSKIGIIPSPACTFCGEADESLEHIFVTCHYTKKFWAEVIKWMGNLNIEIEPLSNKDITFGIMHCKRDLFVNHILLIAKKYIYSCRCNKTKPSIIVLSARIKMIYRLEMLVAKSCNKLPIHFEKWGKYSAD